MKKFNKFFVFLLIAAFLFAGCSSAAPDRAQSNSGSDGSYYESESVAKGEAAPQAPAYEAPAAEPQEGIADSSIPGSGDGTGMDTVSILQPGVNRKIVYTGNIEANTKEFLKDCDMIESRLKEVGGYIENSEISGKPPKEWNDQGRYARMTLRVPSKNFDAFITMLKGIGQNLRTNVYGEDISLQYFDLETKISTLRNRQSRLEEMLKDPAYKLEAIIELERDLAQVSYEIQMLETNRRNYDSLVDFSTIHITLYEVVEFKEITTPEDDLGTRISNGFFAVLNAVASFGEALIIFFAAGSPVLVPLGIIAIVTIVLVKRSKKRKAKAVQDTQRGSGNE